MTLGKKKFQPVISVILNGVCQIYELLLSKNLISFPLTKEGKEEVEALVANINNSYFGREIYSSFEEKAVAYFYFIIKDHPFTDGNKRTGSLVFEVVCALNKLEPNYSKIKLDEIAVFIEKTQEQDHQKVIKSIVPLIIK
jgi:DNA ligase (NAD+)